MNSSRCPHERLHRAAKLKTGGSKLCGDSSPDERLCELLLATWYELIRSEKKKETPGVKLSKKNKPYRMNKPIDEKIIYFNPLELDILVTEKKRKQQYGCSW